MRSINIKRILPIAFFAACLAAAALFFGKINNNTAVLKNENRDVLELRSVYKKACAVVEGECIVGYISPSGVYCSALKVKNAIAGDGTIKDGSVISIVGECEKGKDYIVYIENKVNDVHSENESFYTPVENGVFAVEDEKLILSDERNVEVSSLKSDIEKMSENIMIPSKFLYYETIGELAANADSVFIGRVQSVENSDTELFSIDRGEETHRRETIKNITVTVIDGLIWQYGYGDSVNIISLIENSDEIYNARTNEFVKREENLDDINEGDIYVFFVKKSPDSKSENYFLVNGIQGMIKTDGKKIYADKNDVAFKGVWQIAILRAMLCNNMG